MIKTIEKYRLFLTALTVFLAATFAVGQPAAGYAAAGPWAQNDHGRLRLISAGDTTEAGAAVNRGLGDGYLLGLQVEMEPGWDIYWRSPGDAGFPPTLDWAGSHNLASAVMEWPVPHRFSLFGLETFGYDVEVVLPLVVQPEDPAAPLDLKARVDYLTCNEICVPHSEALSLSLPPAAARSGGADPELYLLDYYRRQVPRRDDGAGLAIESVHLEGSLEAPVLVAAVRSTKPFTAPDLLIEGPPDFSFAKPEVTLSEDGTAAELRLAAKAARNAGVLEGKQLILTLTDVDRGVEDEALLRFRTLPPDAAQPAGLPAFDWPVFLRMLGLALLGGLVLNLMPCVLPVLSIKLLSVLKLSGRERRDVRASFLATAAGILFSFLVLASVALALKAAGLSVGWGIQFQQPLFLLAMTLLLTLFACNLMGLFEIHLPAAVGDHLTPGDGRGLGGSFLTGAFATLLATPCSAPFLGTAVGFALARGPLEILSIFAALGLGLSLPYLTVAAKPGLASLLPKPGVWMLYLKRVLGLGLAGFAVWLLHIVAVQAGTEAAAVAGLLLVALALLLWGGRRLFGPERRLATPVLATLLAVAVLLLPVRFAQHDALAEASAEDAWPVLDPAGIASLVDGGQVVFVDVTADWCITCQVNKQLVLSDPAVQARLSEGGVALQRGDWTSPDPLISAYLADHERYGIPFNAVYGPAAKDGILLPELLTKDAVLSALDKAAGRAAGKAAGS